MASPDPEISFDRRSVLSDHSSLNTVEIYSGNNKAENPENAQHMTEMHKNKTNNNPFRSGNVPENRQHGDYQIPPTFNVPIQHSLKKPDSYDGTKCFEQYMSHFEDCSELSCWDYRTKVLVLASSLRGAARNYYMSLSESERREYETLTLRLSQRFGSSKHQTLWLSKFENRRRLRGESISSLSDYIRQLAQKAYSDLDPIAVERLALNQLYKQISGDMHCRCIDTNCHTVNDAVSVIERYEAILGTPQPTHVRAVDAYDITQPESQILSAVQRLEARIERIEKTHFPSSPVIRPYKSQRACFGCNSPSHFWRNCQQNVNNTLSPNDQRCFMHPRPCSQDRPNNNFHPPNVRPFSQVPNVPPRSTPPKTKLGKLIAAGVEGQVSAK
jgi:hypothetical protein